MVYVILLYKSYRMYTETIHKLYTSYRFHALSPMGDDGKKWCGRI